MVIKSKISINNKTLRIMDIKENTYKVGDKVKFGCYGYFDVEEPYTIEEIRESPLYLGGWQYLLKSDRGHSVTAFSDEILPYNS